MAAVLFQELFTKFKSYSGATYALLIGSTWLTSTTLIATSYVGPGPSYMQTIITIGHCQIYQSHYKASMHKMNLLLFTLILVAHLTNIVLHLLWGSPVSSQSMGAPWTNIPPPTRNTVVSGTIVLIRAIIDIISISVLRCGYHLVISYR